MIISYSWAKLAFIIFQVWLITLFFFTFFIFYYFIFSILLSFVMFVSAVNSTALQMKDFRWVLCLNNSDLNWTSCFRFWMTHGCRFLRGLKILHLWAPRRLNMRSIFTDVRMSALRWGILTLQSKNSRFSLLNSLNDALSSGIKDHRKASD